MVRGKEVSVRTQSAARVAEKFGGEVWPRFQAMRLDIIGYFNVASGFNQFIVIGAAICWCYILEGRERGVRSPSQSVMGVRVPQVTWG